MKTPKKQLPKLRAPHGYHFKIHEYSPSDVNIRLVKNKSGGEVGYINLNETDDATLDGTPIFETHSHLDYEHRGKGWGTLLYARAIKWALKHGYKVGSSYGPSIDARNVWVGKGLRKHFFIRRQNKHSGPWYAYAKSVKQDRTKHKRR